MYVYKTGNKRIPLSRLGQEISRKREPPKKRRPARARYLINPGINRNLSIYTHFYTI